jgi:hypothetical protein
VGTSPTESETRIIDAIEPQPDKVYPHLPKLHDGKEEAVQLVAVHQDVCRVSYPPLQYDCKACLLTLSNYSFTVIAVGGPALTMWITPTEEELFKKYNPDLQKKSLETRHQRQQEFDDFVTKLKEYSKSSKPSMQPQLPALYA